MLILFCACLTLLLLQQSFTIYVRACDPSNPNYAYYGTNYTLKITSLTSDKDSYMPGDTATISGTVSLQAVDVYYSSDCGQYSYGQPYQADPTGVAVTLSTGATTAADSNGAFSFSVPIPADASSGNTQYTVTATHTPSGASDSGTVTLAVTAFAPKLSVTGSSTYYPGDTIVFAGAGWVPNQPVTVQFLGLQAQETGPTFSDQFVIPENAGEGTLNILGTQAPNLRATTTVTVQWRPLTLSLNAQQEFQDGSTVTVTGSVMSNNGPVEGASVTVTYSESLGGTQLTANGATAADGAFSIPLSLPVNGAWAEYKFLLAQHQSPLSPQGTISATATKNPGYKSPSNTEGYTVRVSGPSDSGLNGILELSEFPLAGLTTISLAQVVVEVQAIPYAAAGLGTVSLGLPVAMLVVSAGAFVGIAYYLQRNPAPKEGPQYSAPRG